MFVYHQIDKTAGVLGNVLGLNVVYTAAITCSKCSLWSHFKSKVNLKDTGQNADFNMQDQLKIFKKIFSTP